MELHIRTSALKPYVQLNSQLKQMYRKTELKSKKNDTRYPVHCNAFHSSQAICNDVFLPRLVPSSSAYFVEPHICPVDSIISY